MILHKYSSCRESHVEFEKWKHKHMELVDHFNFTSEQSATFSKSSDEHSLKLSVFRSRSVKTLFEKLSAAWLIPIGVAEDLK